MNFSIHTDVPEYIKSRIEFIEDNKAFLLFEDDLKDDVHLSIVEVDNDAPRTVVYAPYTPYDPDGPNGESGEFATAFGEVLEFFNDADIEELCGKGVTFPRVYDRKTNDVIVFYTQVDSENTQEFFVCPIVQHNDEFIGFEVIYLNSEKLD
jgi:hypothetical protein